MATCYLSSKRKGSTLSSQLEKYVQRRKDAEYIISCEPKPLGTGGAIKLAEQHIRSDVFLVLNGDTRVLIGYDDMMNFHLQIIIRVSFHSY